MGELTDTVQGSTTLEEKTDAIDRFLKRAGGMRGKAREYLGSDANAEKIGQMAGRLAILDELEFDVVESEYGRPVWAECRECGKRYRFNSVAWIDKHARTHGND